MDADDMSWQLECHCGTLRHKPDNDTHLSFNGAWVCCDKCEKWNHGDCAGLSQAQAEDINTYICKMCSPSGEAEHDLPPDKRYKRPSGRAPSGMKWNDVTGEWDEIDESYAPPPSKKAKKESDDVEVIPAAKPRSALASSSSSARSSLASSSTGTSIYGSGKSTRNFPNLKDDTPPSSSSCTPSSFDANYWYRRMKKQLEQNRVRFAEPPAVST